MALYGAALARRLKLIADALGTTVEQFRDGAEPRAIADTVECMRLWSELRTDESRASVLVYLRAAIEREAA